MRVVAEGMENEVRGKTPGDKRTLQKFSSIYEEFEGALKAGMPAFQVSTKGSPRPIILFNLKFEF